MSKYSFKPLTTIKTGYFIKINSYVQKSISGDSWRGKKKLGRPLRFFTSIQVGSHD
jgi:hypothetical protein